MLNIRFHYLDLKLTKYLFCIRSNNPLFLEKIIKFMKTQNKKNYTFFSNKKILEDIFELNFSIMIQFMHIRFKTFLNYFRKKYLYVLMNNFIEFISSKTFNMVIHGHDITKSF